MEPISYKVNPRSPLLFPAEREAVSFLPTQYAQDLPNKVGSVWDTNYMNLEAYNELRNFHAQNFAHEASMSRTRTKSATVDPMASRWKSAGPIRTRPPVESFFAMEEQPKASLRGAGGYINSEYGEKMIPRIIKQRIDSINRQEGLPPLGESDQERIADEDLLNLTRIQAMITELVNFYTGAQPGFGLREALATVESLHNILIQRGYTVPVSDLRDYKVSAEELLNIAMDRRETELVEDRTRFNENDELMVRYLVRIVDLLDYLIAVNQFARSRQDRKALLRSFSKRALVSNIRKASDPYRERWWQARLDAIKERMKVPDTELSPDFETRENEAGSGAAEGSFADETSMGVETEGASGFPESFDSQEAIVDFLRPYADDLDALRSIAQNYDIMVPAATKKPATLQKRIFNALVSRFL